MSMYMTKNKKELVVSCDCKCGQSFGVSVDDDWKDYCYSDTIMTKEDYEEFKSYINQF